MTYWTTSSTSTSASTGSWTYSYSPNLYQTWSTNDCSGYARAAVRYDDSAERRRKKEAELQKAFDEVFDGQ